MPNNYYERLSEMNPGELADGLALEQEFDAISRGFSKLPAPHRDGGGFEGPTKVGEPVEQGDAVNLSSLEKLNLPIYRKKITTENWNDITTPGIYDVVGASGPNKPDAYNYGVLNVYRFNGAVTHIYYPDRNDECIIAKRTCQNIELNNWGLWSLLLGGTQKSTCLVNATGTGAPHETIAAQLPANIAVNSRYVLPNPFGNSTPVECWAEIFLSGKWSRVSWIWDPSGGWGVLASYVQGEGIVVQTGLYRLAWDSNKLGGGHGVSGNSYLTAPCRVFVSRVDK